MKKALKIIGIGLFGAWVLKNIHNYMSIVIVLVENDILEGASELRDILDEHRKNKVKIKILNDQLQLKQETQ